MKCFCKSVYCTLKELYCLNLSGLTKCISLKKLASKKYPQSYHIVADPNLISEKNIMMMILLFLYNIYAI